MNILNEDNIIPGQKIPLDAIYAKSAEEMVLGAILLEENAIIYAQTYISENSFYYIPNKTIYKIILDLQKEESAIDILTVTQKLRDQKKLKSVGGAPYIASLTSKIASSAHIEEHCVILKEKEITRGHVMIIKELSERLALQSSDPIDNIEWLSEKAYATSSLTEIRSVRTNREILADFEHQVDQATKEKGLTGTPTGFSEVDKLYGGYQAPNMIVKAARPGMGKTAHAICEAVYAATEANKKVLFFSLEMSDVELMGRMVSIVTEIELKKYHKGEITSEQWTHYHKTVNSLLTDNLIIIDDHFSIRDIRNRAKRELLKGPLGLIVIDYLQLVEAAEAYAGLREQEVSHNSRQCKLLAKACNCPVLALSQLSRSLENRGDKKPILSDLRESGAIEQDADIVQFLYRPEYYDIFEDENGDSTIGLAYLITAKHRNGGLQDIKLKWEPQYTKFKEWGGHTSPLKALQPNQEFDNAKQLPPEKDEDGVPF